MSDNLDDFLRQAAERRAKRQQQKSGGTSQNTIGSATPAPQNTAPPNRNAPPPPSQTRTSQSSGNRPRQSFPSPNTPSNQEIVVAELAPDTRSKVGNLQPSLATRHVESNLEYADERMDSHLHESFTSKLQSGGRSSLRPSAAAPSPSAAVPPTKTITSSDLKEQLRNPQTLRLAILAQEVLNRPYS